MGNKLHYEPPGKCSTLRSGGTGEPKEVRSVMRTYHKRERILSVFSLAPGSVYGRGESKTAGGDAYCTENVGTAGTERMRRTRTGEWLTKGDRNGDGGNKLSDKNILWKGYNPKKEEREKGRSHHIRQ